MFRRISSAVLWCNHHWGYPTNRPLDFLDYIVPYKFLPLCLEFGLTLNGTLLWDWATGVTVLSTWRSNCTPPIFLIPWNRSAYSTTSLLMNVSGSVCIAFIITTRPRPSAVWNPIKGSLLVFPWWREMLPGWFSCLTLGPHQISPSPWMASMGFLFWQKVAERCIHPLHLPTLLCQSALRLRSFKF